MAGARDPGRSGVDGRHGATGEPVELLGGIGTADAEKEVDAGADRRRVVRRTLPPDHPREDRVAVDPERGRALDSGVPGGSGLGCRRLARGDARGADGGSTNGSHRPRLRRARRRGDSARGGRARPGVRAEGAPRLRGHSVPPARQDAKAVAVAGSRPASVVRDVRAECTTVVGDQIPKRSSTPTSRTTRPASGTRHFTTAEKGYVSTETMSGTRGVRSGVRAARRLARRPRSGRAGREQPNAAACEERRHPGEWGASLERGRRGAPCPR